MKSGFLQIRALYPLNSPSPVSSQAPCLPALTNPQLSPGLPPIRQGGWQYTLGLAKGPATASADGLSTSHSTAL